MNIGDNAPTITCHGEVASADFVERDLFWARYLDDSIDRFSDSQVGQSCGHVVRGNRLKERR
jgi:hypothetical protein